MKKTNREKDCKKCNGKPEKIKRGKLPDENNKPKFKIKFCEECLEVTEYEEVEVVKPPKSYNKEKAENSSNKNKANKTKKQEEKKGDQLDIF